MRRFFCLSLISALVLSAWLHPLRASALDLSRDEVRALFSSLNDTLDEALFAEEPSIAAPYACGQLSASQQSSALNMLNALRTLAGLNTVALSDKLSVQAQHAAVLCAAQGSISHAPECPEDMPTSFYETGASAAARCNLAQFNWHEARLSARAMLRFMQDDTPGNLVDLGHRRWMLSPSMVETGLGLALDEPGRTYLALYVTDDSAAFDYNYIAWPCAGAFPADLMNAETPWSLSLNPQKYDLSAGSLRVTLSEETSGASWTFEPQEITEPTESYCTLSTGRYGDGPALIFRPHLAEWPELQSGYEQNQRWQVTLSGLIDANGAPCEDIVFQTTLCSLTPIDPAGIELSARSLSLSVGESVQPAAMVYPRWADNLEYTLSVSDPAVARLDAAGTLTALSPGVCTLTATACNGRSDEITVTVAP